MLNKHKESGLFIKNLSWIYSRTNSNIFTIKGLFEVFSLRKSASKFSPEMDIKNSLSYKAFL